MIHRLVLLFIGFSLVTTHAQTPTFRAGVDIVRIDAVVVDAKGIPIRGLKAEDFAVFEDGKERPIVGFDAIDMPPAAVPEVGDAPWIRSAPRDVITNKLEDRRLFMIVIDDAMMPFDVRAIARAKSIAKDVVSRLGVNDQAAVVFTMRSKKSQAFTSDHRRLLDAIDATTFGEVPNSAYGSAWTLANAVSALKSAPQARKTLVFVSAGVGVSAGGRAPVMSSAGGGAGGFGTDSLGRVPDELNRMVAAAASAHVNVYAFDVHDLGFVSGNPPMPDLNTPQRDYLRTVADLTGGRASIADDDVAQGITQMFRESSTYYLLGFTSAHVKPGRHRIEVRTTQPGARVMSRKTFDLAAPEKSDARPVSALGSAMSGILPVDSLPMRAVAMAMPGPTTKEAIVAVAVGINQPADGLDGAQERMTAQIDAYQSDGKFVRATKLDARLALRPSASGRAQYDLLGKLPLKPGRYQLRIAAHSPRLSLRGSVFVDIDVPDFSKRGVTVAPLVLSTSPAPPAAPAEAFAGLLPVVPTSHRTFAANDHVSILARIVQGGNKPLVPVSVEVTVVNTKDRRVYGRTEVIAPGAHAANRSADYTFEIPASTLAIGDYLLTVKATTPDGTNEKTVRLSRR